MTKIDSTPSIAKQRLYASLAERNKTIISLSHFDQQLRANNVGKIKGPYKEDFDNRYSELNMGDKSGMVLDSRS